MLKNIILLIILIFTNSNVFADSQNWWDDKWQYRRKVTFVTPADKDPYNTVVTVEFTTGALARNDGRDIVIVDENDKVVPFRILYYAPLDKTILLFQAANRQSKYEIYFGNPNIMAEDWDIWNPQKGLILTTYEAPLKMVKNWEQMNRWMKKPPQKIGVSIAKQIFSPYNPLSPNESYVGVYTGYVSCPVSGEYSFALTSDGASFFLIDDETEPLVQWPGEHKALPDPKYHGETYLMAGVHKIEFYHQAYAFQQKVVLAVKKPGDNKYLPVPEKGFLQPIEAKAEFLEKTGKISTADFTYTREHSLRINDNQIYCFRFWAPLVEGNKYLWNFGDGTTGSGNEISHIYLVSGKYQVVLTVEDTTNAIEEYKLMVKVLWDPDEKEIDFDKVLKNDYEQIKNYKLDNLDANSLWMFLIIANKSKDDEQVLNISNLILEKSLDVSDDKKYFGYLYRAEALKSDKFKNYEKAIKTYEEITLKFSKPEWISSAYLGIGKTLLDNMQDYDKAIATFTEMLKKNNDLKNPIVRAGQILLGDAYLKKGDLQSSKIEYMKVAQKDAMTYEKETIISGDYATRTEGYIYSNNFADAVTMLDEWESKLPWEKLDGYTFLLRGKVFSKQNKYEDALKYLEQCMKISKNDDYTGEALYLTAEANFSLGKKDIALQYYNRVISECSEDMPFYEDVKKKLAELNAKQQ
ncbi:MAG: PKD domain-containing protein [Candidatus Firestonebacteria bacterium]